MGKKTYRLQKRVGSKARIIKPYKITKTGFEDIGLYARFPWHQTFLDSFVGGWSVAINHPCFDQSLWNTRTIPVIAVNDINSGIIDLAWCLLYIPFHFKMTVKSAIHCQGLWNECRDKALLDRFRSALRFYYSLEANFHKEEFEEGIRHSYRSEMSYGGRDGKGIWIRQNMNRLPYQQLKGVSMEDVEEGLRQWYHTHVAWDLKGEKFGHQVTKTRRPVTDLIPDIDKRALEDGLRHYYHHEGSFFGLHEKKSFGIRKRKQKTILYPTHNMNTVEHEEALRRWYQKTHSFGGGGGNFQYDIDSNRGCLHQGEPLGLEMEDALRSWYLSQHSYGSRKAFRFSQNVQRNMNVGSEGKKKDYYDEIHSRLRWMQIFNEDYARFMKRFVGKMDCGFMYLDPPYMKTIEGKHYEDILTLEQHHELSHILHEAEKVGTKFLLSYDVDERVEKMYSSFDFEKIQVPYSVARSYGDGRAQYDEEYLIRNYNLKEDPYLKKVDFTKKTKLDAFLS